MMRVREDAESHASSSRTTATVFLVWRLMLVRDILIGQKPPL